MAKEKLLRAIAIITTLCILSGCVYSHVTHMNDDQLEWFESDMYGCQTVFISNKGNTDTIRHCWNEISNKKKLFNFSEAEFNPNKDYIAGGTISYTMYSTDHIIITSIDITLPVKSDSLKFYSSIFYLPLETTMPISDIINPPHIISQFTVDNCVYSDCIIFYISQSEDFFKKRVRKIDNCISKYVWARGVGLIYYELENGEYFIRSDEPPTPIVYDRI